MTHKRHTHTHCARVCRAIRRAMRWKPAIFDRSRPAVRATEWGALVALAMMLAISALILAVSGREFSFSWSEMLERNRHWDWGSLVEIDLVRTGIAASATVGVLVWFLVLMRSVRFHALGSSLEGVGGGTRRAALQPGHLPLSPPGVDSRIADLKSDVLDMLVRCSDLSARHLQGGYAKNDEDDIARRMQQYIAQLHGEFLAWMKAGGPGPTSVGNGEPHRYGKLLVLLEDYYGEDGGFSAFMQAAAAGERPQETETEPEFRRRKLREYICTRQSEFLDWLNTGGPSSAIVENDKDEQCHLLFGALKLHYGKRGEFLCWMHGQRTAEAKAAIEQALHGGRIPQKPGRCVQPGRQPSPGPTQAMPADEIDLNDADMPTDAEIEEMSRLAPDDESYRQWLASDSLSDEHAENNAGGVSEEIRLWRLLKDLDGNQRAYFDYYASARYPGLRLARIESRLMWYVDRHLDALVETGRRVNAISIDETLQDLLQRLTDRFSLKAMVASGLLAETASGSYEPPHALLRDAPIYPHFDQAGRALALSHSLSPILGTEYDDMLWDRRGIYRAGETDGILFITSGIYYGSHLRARGFNAIAIHPHAWAHPEFAASWPLPRSLDKKMFYGSGSVRARQIEGFVQWIARMSKAADVRRVYYDLPRDYPDIMGKDSIAHRVMPRFLFRHFVRHYLAPALRSNGIEVVAPSRLPWSVIRETQGPCRQSGSPSRILELAGPDIVGAKALLNPTWSIVEPYLAAVVPPVAPVSSPEEDQPGFFIPDTMASRLPKDAESRQEWNRLLGWERPHGNAKDIRSIEDLALYVDYLTQSKWMDTDKVTVPEIGRPITPASAMKTLKRRMAMVDEAPAALKSYLDECLQRIDRHITTT